MRAMEQSLSDSVKIAKSHHSAGRLDEAEAMYREILTVEPQEAETLQMLGTLLSQKGLHDDGLAMIERAIRVRPDVAGYHANHGLVLSNIGYLDLAVDAFHKALQLEPKFPEALYNLGNVLLRREQVDDAIECYRQALAIRPDDASGHCNLGSALIKKGQMAEAAAALRRAIDFRVDYAEAMSNLGTALLREKLDEAIEWYTKAAALRPQSMEMVNNLAGALKDAGRLEEAMGTYRRALATEPNAIVHSNLIFTMQFHAEGDGRAIAMELGKWNVAHGQPQAKYFQKPLNHSDPNRRMKVGYVSPNFFKQSEAHFALPLLAGHDRQQVEVHCFSLVKNGDEFTQWHRQVCDVWHDVAREDDDALTKRIREANIDILVDLTMHMGENRLLVFARKPAPVQVTWLAYPGSTGLETVDCRLTDAYIDPPDSDVSVYSEKSIRLPGCWCCYDPLSDAPGRPAEQKGPITFGSLNNPCKINPRTLRLWAQIAHRVPDSQFLILSISERQRLQIRRMFDEVGVKFDRLDLVSTSSREEYLRLYDRIDIALDPQPYNGITTTCDALWMGVPVVAMIGQSGRGRAAASILKTAGLEQWIARSPEQYVQTAAALAADVPQLVNIRAGLRQKFLESPMVDARKFASEVEAVYRQLWTEWCARLDS
jgi:protein O-GlcNAc transferase